jgi:L-asparaginase / beta-aspartyl-peptidase
MSSKILLAALILLASSAQAAPVAIAVHGGAGTIERSSLSRETEQAIRADLERAARAGYQVLQNGGSSVEANIAAVMILEDSPHFNAGKGAVFNAAGEHELDAAIMDGAKRRAGAIAGVRRVRNPILLAREVMLHSEHVMLTGAGAENFARSKNIKFASERYFYTEHRWQQLQAAKKLEKLKPRAALSSASYFGTVGAVSLDQQGGLSAATSTGGMTNKRFGRVGDSPLIGAGTYADRQCAVSATGHGEFFIRSVVAHNICARVAYRGDRIDQAAEAVVLDELKTLGGDGGVIAIDQDGKIAMPFNSAGMYRAMIDTNGTLHVHIYRDE